MTAEVPPSREVRITLPADVPLGPAEITVVVASHASNEGRILGDLLNSEVFEMWRDREDIGDSVEFARSLRIEGWSRSA